MLLKLARDRTEFYHFVNSEAVVIRKHVSIAKTVLL
jgi:hypothetical protein